MNPKVVMKKNDAHFHLGTGVLSYKSPSSKGLKATVRDFIQIRGPNNKLSLWLSRKIKGTRKAVVLAAPEPGNVVEHLAKSSLRRRYDRFNKRALSMKSKNIIPMVFFDSRVYSIQDLKQLLGKFRAVKLYPSRDVRLKEDAAFRGEVLREIDKVGSVLMLHVVPDNKYSPGFVNDLLHDLSKFHNMKIVFAHFGAFDKRILEFVRSSKNAFLETSGYSSPKIDWFMGVNGANTFMGSNKEISARLKSALSFVGESKVVYGSDHPFLRSIRKKESNILLSVAKNPRAIFEENFDLIFKK
ncbi:MAG: amidohydrolase family protein [archaeon]